MTTTLFPREAPALVGETSSTPLYNQASDFEQPNPGLLEPDNPTRTRSVAENIALGVPAVAMSMFETVGKGVGLLAPDTMGKVATQISPNFGEYYQNNKSAVSFIGDFALTLPLGLVGGAAIRSGSWLYKALNVAEHPVLAKAFTNESQVASIISNITKNDLNLANAARSIDVVTGNTERAAAVMQAQKLNQVNNLKQYLAGETAIALVMHGSENIYPSDIDTVDQLLLHSVGIGITGGVQWAATRAQIRRSLARPEMQEAFERAVFATDLPADVRNVKNDRDLAATIYALNSAEQRATRMGAEGEFADKLKENTSAYALAFDSLGAKVYEGMMRDGLPEIFPQSRNQKLVQTVLRAGQQDPTVFPGMRTFTDLPKLWSEVEEIQASKVKKIDSLMNRALKNDTPEANIKLEAEIADLKRTNFYVLEADSTLTPVSKRKPQWQDDPSDITFVKPHGGFENGRYDVSFTDPVGGVKTKFGFDHFGISYLPEGKTSTNMTPFEMSAMQGLIQHAAEKFNWESHTAALKNVTLASSLKSGQPTDYFMLEFANRVIGKDSKAVAAFKFPEGAAGGERAWLETELLSRKYDIYKAYRDKIGEAYSSQFKVANWLEPQFEDLKNITNLPKSKFGGEHPALQVFEAFYKQGEKDFTSAVKNLDDFYSMMKASALDTNHIFDKQAMMVDESIAKWYQGKLTTDGGLFGRPQMKGGDFFPSTLVAIKSVPYHLTQDTLTQVATARRMQFLSEFANPETTPEFVRSFTEKFLGSSAFEAARTVKSLAEGMQSGSGILTSQGRATSGLDTFTAVDMIANVGEKHAAKITRDLLESHQETWIALRKKENSGSMYNLAEFAWARRFGFEIEKAEDSAGNMKFLLKTKGEEDGGGLTQRNVEAYKKMFNTDKLDPADPNLLYLPKFQSVKDLSVAGHQPMQVSSLAFGAISAIDEVSQKLLESTNFFRRLYGQGEIASQPFYVPPQNFNNQYIKYIVKPVEGGGQPIKQMISGKTPEELNQKLSKVIGVMKESGQSYEIVDLNQLKQYQKLHGEAFFNMVDYGDGVSQLGSTKGSSASPLLLYGEQVLSDLLKSVEAQSLNLSRQTLSSVFENELRYARMADGFGRTGDEAKDAKLGVSIFRMYQGRLLSDTRILADENSSVLSGTIGDLFDKGLIKLSNTFKSYLPENAGKLLSSSDDHVAAMNAKAGKDFDALRIQLGGYLPFSDTAAFVENTFKVKSPVGAREIAGTLNTITANLTLRILDAGNAYVSLLGNIVSMPLVMNMMKRQPWDTEGSFAARTGFFGTQINKDFAIPSTGRMSARTMSFAMTPEGKEVIREGYEVYGNLQKRMSDAFDAIHDPLQNQAKSTLNKTINFLSTPSDKGEELTRGWAYLSGYLMAKEGFKVGNDVDRHMMANLFANTMIADYRGVNKPQIFQGALGSTLGMFQTYMWQYYSRMFGYIENKSYRALAINYAMQSAVFGANSVPGYQQFNSMYQSAYDSKRDINDALDAKFGSATASVLQHGAFSNIPRIFGRDGINIYSRGDVNVSKVPAFISPENAPIVNLAKNAVGFFGELVGQIRTGGQVNPQQTLEALGTYAINRPFGRVMELIAGTTVDQRGAVISNDVRNTMSVVSRVMGLRPTSETASMEALYRVSTSEAYQRDLNERITNSVRSIFRGNPSADKIDHSLGQALSDYIKGGGNPKNASSFIKDAVISAHISKAERKLMSVIGNPGRTNDMMRLIGAMSQYDVE